MCKNYIAEEWYNYEQNVMPKDAGDVQRQETKRAFYGGALALYMRILRSPGTEEESISQGVQVVADVEAAVAASAYLRHPAVASVYGLD